MPVNMNGYKVAYGKHVYTCLQVEPIFGPECNETDHITYPEFLRVFIVDHDTRFAVIEDCSAMFSFLKG
jgi:hypothetical protein